MGLQPELTPEDSDSNSGSGNDAPAESDDDQPREVNTQRENVGEESPRSEDVNVEDSEVTDGSDVSKDDSLIIIPRPKS